MSNNKKKLINISESTIKGSKTTVDCPNCGTNINPNCEICFGSGEVSMNKVHRLKESSKKNKS